MTPDVRTTIGEYRRAAEAELALLEQLVECAARQHDASRLRDASALAAAAARRETIMAQLMEVEQAQPLRRALLVAHLAEAGLAEAFDAVRQLHRRAERRLADVVAIDGETRARLLQSDETRRSTAQAIEAGEATLAAYRKVLAPDVARSGIVDKRG